MAIREVLLSNTFEQQRQLINLIGTDIGDCQNLVTPSKVVTTSVNQVVAGLVTLSGQTIQLEDGSLSSPSLSFDSVTNLGLCKYDSSTIGFSNNVFINGGLTVAGDVTFRAGTGTGGTLTFGDLNTDNIVFNADINSTIIPDLTATYDIGASSQRWRDLYLSRNLFANYSSVTTSGVFGGNLSVNGDTLSTSSNTFNLLNNPLTVNAFTNATSISLGYITGTLTLNNPTVVGTQSTVNLWNTTTTVVNAFGTASGITIGYAAPSGIPNTNFTIKSDDTILDGDLNVNGGEIISSQNTFNLLINNSDVRIGSAIGTGTTKINNNFKVSGNSIDLATQGVTVSIIDNVNPALSIREGSNSYLDFQTSDGLEKIIAYKNVNLLGSLTGTSASFTGDLTASGVTVNGNLTVNGTTSTINSTVLSIDDVNIILADGASTSAAVDGAGITLGTTGITFTYSNTGTRWSSTENLNIANTKTYQINGTTVLSSTQVLGKGFTNAAGEIVTTDGTQTLTNKTLTTPTISSILNTGTLTLPTSTDTLVGRATSDTLTNKTYGNSSSTSDADATVDSATTSYYAYVQSASGTARTINISNLTAGRVITLYLRNTNAATKQINIAASTTTTGFAAVNLSPGSSAGGASVTSVTLAVTSGTAVVTVFNANGTIGGSIA
jgi:hypothetical protein